jgi:hypothetical protein
MTRATILSGLAAVTTLVSASVPAMAETVTIVSERIQRVSVSTAPSKPKVRTMPLWSAPKSTSHSAVGTPGLLEGDGAFAQQGPGGVGAGHAGGVASSSRAAGSAIR